MVRVVTPASSSSFFAASGSEVSAGTESLYGLWVGGIGVLCQLGAAGDFRSVLEEWLPGFAE